jgi:hypothetical protein
MDHDARVAFVQAQTVCAQAELFAMVAHNQAALHEGKPPFFNKDDFMAVPDRYQIGWNTVIEYLRDG